MNHVLVQNNKVVTVPSNLFHRETDELPTYISNTLSRVLLGSHFVPHGIIARIQNVVVDRDTCILGTGGRVNVAVSYDADCVFPSGGEPRNATISECDEDDGLTVHGPEYIIGIPPCAIPRVYTFDSLSHTYINKNGGRAIKIGDQVRIAIETDTCQVVYSMNATLPSSSARYACSALLCPDEKTGSIFVPLS